MRLTGMRFKFISKPGPKATKFCRFVKTAAKKSMHKSQEITFFSFLFSKLFLKSSCPQIIKLLCAFII